MGNRDVFHDCPFEKSCIPKVRLNTVYCPSDRYKLAIKPHPECRQKCKGREWECWYKRNAQVIKHIANNLNVPPGDLADLMSNMTLQTYSQMINPKGKGWNMCRVPFSRCDLCDRYLTIFDLDGNVNYPKDPESMHCLLNMLHLIAAADPYRSAVLKAQVKDFKSLDLNFEAEAVRKGPAILELVNRYRPSLEFQPLGLIEKSIMKNLPRQIEKGSSKRASIAESLGAPDKKGQQNFRRNKRLSIADLYEKSRMNQLIASDLELFDRFGRRHGHGTRQLDILITRQKEILQLMLKRKKAAESDILETLATDPQAQKQINKADKEAAKNISKFYEAVVTDDSKMRRVRHSKHLKSLPSKMLRGQSTVKPTNEPNPPAKEPTKDRKYNAESLPVMYHAPFDPGNAQTWLRREPNQLRMQDTGDVTVQPLGRYRRESVKEQLQAAGTRYSIHSLSEKLKPQLDTQVPAAAAAPGPTAGHKVFPNPAQSNNPKKRAE